MLILSLRDSYRIGVKLRDSASQNAQMGRDPSANAQDGQLREYEA
ncbi:MAG: hypothetical protein AAFO91_15875 [Bacteroidota bacterium]